MRILAFAASNSRKSINKQLARYAGSLIENAEVELLDINNYEMPIYSADREEESGIPQLAHDFYAKIGGADALVISYAEHNGSYTAAYKNLYDWTSRIEMKVYQNKSMVMLATSPGPGGAKTVLAAATTSAPYFGGDLKGSLSVPSFFSNFDAETGVVSNPEIQADLKSLMTKLAASQP